MEPLLPDDTLWRNLRLATLDPAQTAPYGMLDHHALIIRKGRVLAIVPEASLPTAHANTHDLQGRLVKIGRAHV